MGSRRLPDGRVAPRVTVVGARAAPAARAAVVVAALLAVACTPEQTAAPPHAAPATAAASGAAAAPSESAPRPDEPRPSARRRDRDPTGAVPPPAWLGTRVLPRAANGYGEVRPTPRILRNRRLITTDRLPPPRGRFRATVRRVPPAVAGRSTWDASCPVALADLRYVTVSFWGFDDRPHTGELLVNATAARDVARVFGHLYRRRFPIEEMRIVSPPELDAPPTGDGNNTTAFVCRPARGSTAWSQHAYGLAVDVNPFANPYVRGDVVLPELASAYTDRAWHRPGMHQPHGTAVRAFAAIGWKWGGTWNEAKDWMHFSANGR